MDALESGRIFDWLQETSYKKKIPLNVSLELTYRCNLRCRHCYIPGASASTDELSTSEVKHVLDQLMASGSMFLTLTGGEALVRRDFWDIADYAKSQGFGLRIFSNGSLITREVSHRIKQLFPIAVEISLYGATAQTHDSITRVSGSYARTLQGIDNLLEDGVNTVVKNTWMSLNCQEVRSYKRMMDEKGINHNHTVMVSPRNDGDATPCSYRLDDDQLRHVIATFRQTERDTSKEEQYPDEGKSQDIGGIPICNAGNSSCRISPDGGVYPCVQFQEKAGNLRETSFASIWNKAGIFKQLRRITRRDLTQCKNCEYMAYCYRCPGLAMLETQDLTAPDSVSCQIAKIRKEIYEEA